MQSFIYCLSAWFIKIARLRFKKLNLRLQIKSKQKGMFGRNKIDPFDTINMCNQFLLVYLIKKVQNFESRGLGKNAMVYRNAIYSIKRYPLPIICKAQLESITGIGEYLSQELQKVIKKHYEAYLDSNLQEKNKVRQTHDREDELSRSNAHRSQRLEEVNENSQQDSKNSKQSGIQYKPRINTANAYFLQALRKIISQKQNHHSKGVQKQVLQAQVQQKYPSAKNKTWKNIEEVLQSNGYITVQKIQDSCKKEKIFYKLTQKGLNYTNTIDKKTKTNTVKNKIINEVKFFKEQVEIKNKETKTKQHKQNLDGFCLIDDPEEEEIRKKLALKPLILNQHEICFQKLTLIVDNREKKEKSQEINFFCQKMVKKFKINCKTASLNLGDFLWVYDGKVLDYIIERKKADDLAASILDGRYKDQKYRLKNCGISNIYYVYEGHPSENCCLTQKQLKSALLKTRFRQNFKVITTKDVSQTMDMLNVFHKQIFQSIVSNQVKYLSSFDEFNECNSVQRNMTVGHVFALGMMSIPGVGKNAIRVITQYFKTYRQMYNCLQRVETNAERIQFLKLLFKGTGVISTFPETMVAILFSKSYKQENRQQEQEKRKYSSTVQRQRIVERQQRQFESVGFENRRFSVIHEESYNQENQNFQFKDRQYQQEQNYLNEAQEEVEYEI